jgi:hypothetical protein
MKKLISFTCSFTALNLYTNYLALKRLTRVHKVGIDRTVNGMMLDSFRAYRDMPEHGEVVLQGVDKFLRVVYRAAGMEELSSTVITTTRDMIRESGNFETMEELFEHAAVDSVGLH